MCDLRVVGVFWRSVYRNYVSFLINGIIPDDSILFRIVLLYSFFCHSYNLLRFWFSFLFNSIYCAYFCCHDFLFISQQVFRRRVGELENLTGEQIEKSRKELADLERKFLERVAQTNRSKTTGGGVVKCTSDKIIYFYLISISSICITSDLSVFYF